MVEIPQTKSLTVAAIEAAVEATQNPRHHPYIRGSAIGKCERHQWYVFRWSHKPELFEGRILRLFDTGNVYEARMIEWLRMAGVDVIDRDEATGRQLSVTGADGHFRGHLDGICSGVKEAPKTLHLLECKTHNAKSFAQLVRHGVAVSKPDHVAQMQIYMHHKGLTRALYLAGNKDTDELYAERLHYDPAHAASLDAKAERVKNASAPAPKISDDPTFFECRYCPSKNLCHFEGWALRNCRTCVHSTPVQKGVWHCDRHDRYLSYGDQLLGCANHLFLPSLVPGQQVDYDEANETVTYELPDGVTWVDNGPHREDYE